VFSKERNSQVLVTDVPRCTSSNAKTLGLNNLLFSEVAAGSGPPNGARIVHHGPNELLIQQNSVPDGQTASPVKERANQTQSLGSFLLDQDDMRRPGHTCIKDHSQITGCFDPLDWFP
jgi:hypothetical protein